MRRTWTLIKFAFWRLTRLYPLEAIADSPFFGRHPEAATARCKPTWTIRIGDRGWHSAFVRFKTPPYPKCQYGQWNQRLARWWPVRQRLLDMKILLRNRLQEILRRIAR